MEIAKREVAAVEEVVAARVENACRELSELELALIGGGCGDVHFG